MQTKFSSDSGYIQGIRNEYAEWSQEWLLKSRLQINK